MHAQEPTGLVQPSPAPGLSWPQQQEYKHNALTSQPWLKPEPKEGSTSDPSTQETHRSSLTARQSRRSSRRSERPPSPFEALLAVSSNAHSDLPLAEAMPASLPISATQGQPAQAAQPQRKVPSHQTAASLVQNGKILPAALAGMKRERDSLEEHQEGVGTSGGGEMGDTDDSSGNSKRQVFDTYVQEECSGVKEGMRGESGWGAKSRSAKKARMIWTTELHDRFVSAVNHLGLQNAVPKTILKMMNVEGMTRENVASHLQKYRLHLKRQDGAGGAMPLGNPAEQAASNPPMLTTRGMVQGVPVTQALLMSGRLPAFDAPAMGIPVNQAFGQASESSHARLAPWLADSLTYPPFPGTSSALSCQQSAALQLMSLHTPREQPWTGPTLSDPLQAQISPGLNAASAAVAQISKELAAATASLSAVNNGFPGMLDIAPLDYSPPPPPTFGN